MNVSDAGRVPAGPPRHARGKQQQPIAPAKARSAVWLVAGLLVFSAMPLVGGVFRLTQLASGAAITPAGPSAAKTRWLAAQRSRETSVASTTSARSSSSSACNRSVAWIA